MIALSFFAGFAVAALIAFAMLCAGSRRDDADEQIMRRLECGDLPAIHPELLSFHTKGVPHE